MMAADELFGELPEPKRRRSARRGCVSPDAIT
jgi:hypothetical protein